MYFSRGLVISICLAVAFYRLVQGAWIEGLGLLALGGGLVLLQLAQGNRPHLRRWAWASFALTAVSILIVILRDHV